MACCCPGAGKYQVFCLDLGLLVANGEDDAVAPDHGLFAWVFEIGYTVYTPRVEWRSREVRTMTKRTSGRLRPHGKGNESKK